jgi:3-hydroxybutyryl-CoA dehydrogenase
MEIRTIGVVGCGLMGAGVAEVASLAGYRVVALKATAGSVDKARERVKQSFDRAVAKGKLTEQAAREAMSRITFTSDFDALAPCDLVVESTAESMTSKRRYLGDIEAVVSPDAIIATNTSSLPLQELATALARPMRFLGLHFFSPVQAMKLVEVGRLADTSADAVVACVLACEKMGKSPILLGDQPGYIVNRLLVPYLCHAIETLELGVARAKDIDEAMKLGCGHPLGPLALSDLIGLDIVFAMAQTLSQELRDKRFRAPALLRRLVLAGQVGKKTKLGLYDYRGAEPVENPECRAFASAPALTGS